MKCKTRRCAFAVVELLLVIAIISLLLQLALPAVMSAREVARKTQCRNHLKQLGVAMLLHHDAHRHFPTNGWGYRWVGDPGRGFGGEQPGGWIYNILPYIEETELRAIGRRLPPDEKRAKLTGLLQKPIDVLHCPSRRSASLFPYMVEDPPLRNVQVPRKAARCDYAVSAGDHRLDGGEGPASTKLADLRKYNWPKTAEFNGISFVRSRVRVADVRDGTTHTYLVGEKYVPSANYGNGKFAGDDQSAYIGDDTDFRRWTLASPVHDRGAGSKNEFGSPHWGGCHFVLCDGSVREVAYDVDPEVHRRLGNRRDGQVVDLSGL